MPSWPTVVVGAVLVGGLLGAVQKGDVGASAPAAASPVETPTRSVSPSPPARDTGSETAAAGWPDDVRATLPPAEVPQVALTFDDGPDPVWTPQILDVLARHDATATFCVLGSQVSGNEALLRRIHDDGHVLCNHTATHDYGLPARPTEQVDDEIVSVLDQLAEVTPDARVTAFRAPGGRFSDTLVQRAEAHGLTSWAWSVDPQDWRTLDREAIVSAVLDGVVPGSVVLLHDGGGDRSATVAATDEIITVLTDAGFELVGLPHPR